MNTHILALLYLIPIAFFIVSKIIEFINSKIYDMTFSGGGDANLLDFIFTVIAFVPLINFFWILHGTPYIIKNIIQYCKIIFEKIFKKGKSNE
jgi:hypothetical protein